MGDASKFNGQYKIFYKYEIEFRTATRMENSIIQRDQISHNCRK